MKKATDQEHYEGLAKNLSATLDEYFQGRGKENSDDNDWLQIVISLRQAQLVAFILEKVLRKEPVDEPAVKEHLLEESAHSKPTFQFVRDRLTKMLEDDSSDQLTISNTLKLSRSEVSLLIVVCNKAYEECERKEQNGKSD